MSLVAHQSVHVEFRKLNNYFWLEQKIDRLGKVLEVFSLLKFKYFKKKKKLAHIPHFFWHD